MWLAGSYAYAAAAFKIVTADQRGTYFAIGADLAKLVAPSADIDLEVVATDGSAANIRLLREAPGVKFAIVVGLTTLLCLASYHTLVRHTFVGAWLHGPRHQSSPKRAIDRRRAA